MCFLDKVVNFAQSLEQKSESLLEKANEYSFKERLKASLKHEVMLMEIALKNAKSDLDESWLINILE